MIILVPAGLRSEPCKDQPEFPSGLPSMYCPGLMSLNFNDRTGTCRINTDQALYKRQSHELGVQCNTTIKILLRVWFTISLFSDNSKPANVSGSIHLKQA